jgi:hypothetical protein
MKIHLMLVAIVSHHSADSAADVALNTKLKEILGTWR